MVKKCEMDSIALELKTILQLAGLGLNVEKRQVWKSRKGYFHSKMTGVV
jgi:hypothetical protein